MHYRNTHKLNKIMVYDNVAVGWQNARQEWGGREVAFLQQQQKKK